MNYDTTAMFFFNQCNQFEKADLIVAIDALSDEQRELIRQLAETEESFTLKHLRAIGVDFEANAGGWASMAAEDYFLMCKAAHQQEQQEVKAMHTELTKDNFIEAILVTSEHEVTEENWKIWRRATDEYFKSAWNGMITQEFIDFCVQWMTDGEIDAGRMATTDENNPQRNFNECAYYCRRIIINMNNDFYKVQQQMKGLEEAKSEVVGNVIELNQFIDEQNKLMWKSHAWEPARKIMLNNAISCLQQIALKSNLDVQAPLICENYDDAEAEWDRYSAAVVSASEPKQEQQQEEQKVEEEMNAAEFTAQVLEQVEAIEDLFDEQQQEVADKVTSAVKDIEVNGSFAQYFIDSLNALRHTDALKTLLNARITKEFATKAHKDFISGVSVAKPEQQKKIQHIDVENTEWHKSRMKEIKRENQSVKKSQNLCNAKTIGTIQFQVTDEGLAVTMPKHNIVGVKSSTFIRSYLKKRGVTRMGKTLSDGVIFKEEHIQEIIDTLGMNAKTIIELREIEFVEALFDESMIKTDAANENQDQDQERERIGEGDGLERAA